MLPSIEQGFERLNTELLAGVSVGHFEESIVLTLELESSNQFDKEFGIVGAFEEECRRLREFFVCCDRFLVQSRESLGENVALAIVEFLAVTTARE